jgi:hypothetical protein
MNVCRLIKSATSDECYVRNLNLSFIISGEFANDMKNGSGKKNYANGDVFFGSWLNNERDGFGAFTTADGRVYNGEWKHDERHGMGVLTWPDGAVYDGTSLQI